MTTGFNRWAERDSNKPPLALVGAWAGESQTRGARSHNGIFARFFVSITQMDISG
jgi:hypothetical protein